METGKGIHHVMHLLDWEVSARKRAWTIAGVLAFFFVILLVLNILTPLISDDYRYLYSFADGTRIESFADVIRSQVAHYYNMNGRVITHTLCQAFLLLGKPIFNGINAAAFIGLGLLIYYSAFLSLKHLRIHWLVAIYLLMWVLPPFFGESYLWLSGASNYIYGPALALLFLLPYRKYFAKQLKRGAVKQILLSVLLAVLGILSGWAGEGIGIAAVFMAALFILKAILEKQKLQVWMFSGLLFSAVGMYLGVNAPSNLAKISTIGGWLNLQEIVFRFIQNSLNLITSFLPLLILSALILLYRFLDSAGKTQDTKRSFRLPLSAIYGLGALAAVYAYTVTPVFPPRAWNGAVLFAIVMLSCQYSEIEIRPTALQRAVSVVTVVCLLGFFASACGAIYSNYRTSCEDKARIQSIIQQRDSGVMNVVIPTIDADNKYNTFTSHEDLHMQTGPDSQMAKYYGVQSIEKQTTKD
ncbi:MAG: DUF6056 family protein [Eubacteriales bacterium]|nr:DUF6056 family protein [Eubacteriales bacterium]